MFTDPPNSTGTSKKGNANLANRKLAAFATRDIMKVRPAVTGRSSRPRRSILVKIHLRRKNCTITTISSMTHNRAKKIISDPRARGSAINPDYSAGKQRKVCSVGQPHDMVKEIDRYRG
jgi:hypothetical protein